MLHNNSLNKGVRIFVATAVLETDMSQWKIAENYFDKMVMPSLSIWFSHSTECNLKILRSSFILFKDYMKKYYSYQSFWIGPPPFFFPIFQLSTIFHLNDSKVFFLSHWTFNSNSKLTHYQVVASSNFLFELQGHMASCWIRNQPYEGHNWSCQDIWN